MKRNVVVLAMVLSLLVVLSSTVGVMADKPPGVPHEGGCVAYCARAVLYEDFDGDGEWVPWDYDENGEAERCLREFFPGVEQMCHHMGAPICPEVGDRCARPDDGLGFWCRLMHGKDSHGHPH
jgi:hypothetical protein